MWLLLFLLEQCLPSDPPIIVSKQTTYITQPLRPDGLPDYAKYVLDIERRGITSENNAAVLILQATWPAELSAREQDRMRAEIGLKQLPSADEALQPLFADAVRTRVDNLCRSRGVKLKPDALDLFIDRATDHPWTSDKLPPLTDWVEANNKPLDLLVQASLRPQLYFPSPQQLEPKRPKLLNMLLPGTVQVGELRYALGARAMRNLGEKHLQECWRDLLAMHRLAKLQIKSHLQVEQTVAVKTSLKACAGTRALLTCDDMTQDMARQIQKDLESIDIQGDIVDAVNFDRIMILDGALDMKSEIRSALSRVPLPLLGALADVEMKLIPIDYNFGLKQLNVWFDRLETIVKLPTHRKRIAAYTRFDSDLGTLGAQTAKEKQHPQFNRAKRSALIGNILVCMLVPDGSRIINVQDLATTELNLTRIVAALSVYHAQRGTYPERLSELVPAITDRIPLDIYNDEPFIYKRTADGYLLYSVGENAIDDGGSNESRHRFEGLEIDDLQNADPANRTRIPSGADDIAVRIPPSAFHLPGSSAPKGER